jgi:hypothetical protein
VADGPRLERLDFIYMPSSDIARDVIFYREVLGGELVFAIGAMGTRVAALNLAEPGPRLLLAEHLEGEAPILVYRVRDFDAAVALLRDRGAEIESRFGIPHGPCATLRKPAASGLRSTSSPAPRPTGTSRAGSISAQARNDATQ